MNFEKQNRNFWKMGKNRRKVAVAKDVLLQLSMGTIKPETGVYCRIESNNIQQNLQESLINNEFSCRVCGIGAIFVSKVRLANKYLVPDIELNYIQYWGNLHVLASEIRENVDRVFTRDELTTIEELFEGWQLHGYQFRDAVPDESTRLRLIMENIIQNKGQLNVEGLLNGLET